MYEYSSKVTVLGVFLCAILAIPSALNAQQKGSWYLDQSSAAGPLARVDISNSQTFMVVFEHIRKCDPLFSMLDLRVEGNGVGAILDQKALPSGSIKLFVDGTTYTSVGAQAVYQRADEFALMVTEQFFSNIINGIRSIRFIKPNGANYEVPTKGMSKAVIAAASVCIAAIQ